MIRHTLALLPVVTVSGGRARLAPEGFGASTRTGTPAEAIDSWVAQGAAWVHVEDHDAASSGQHRAHAVRRGAHVQYAAGIRDDASLAAALATGADRVVVQGDDVDWAASAVGAHGERLVVALDIRHPAAGDSAITLRTAGCERFLVTDDAATHHWKSGERHLLEEFCARVHRPVMARGGIRHLSDLHALHEVVPHGVDGIVIDDALYDGSFSYTEAVSAGADRFDMFIWAPPE